MTGTYRLVHFISDPMLETSLPVGAVVDTTEGTRLVRAAFTHDRRYLGGERGEALLRMLLDRTERAPSLDCAEYPFGAHLRFGPQRNLPEGVDPAAWVASLLPRDGEDSLVTTLEAQVTALTEELRPHREAAKSYEERRARVQAMLQNLADLAPPEPEMTPEEEAEAAKGFADMFRSCEACGLARMSSVEDESCHCCHGCNRLRRVLYDVLMFYERDDHPIVEKAWEEYHNSDPTDAQILQIAYDLKRRNGLYTQYVKHDEPAGPFQHKDGARLLVALRRDETVDAEGKPLGVFVETVVVERPDATRPLLMRLSMPLGEAKESESWYEVYTMIVDYYRGRGLIPAEDIWPT